MPPTSRQDHAKGARAGFVAHVPEEVDVKAIRKRLALSQSEFAARFGFAVDAVQNWEQGRRRGAGAGRGLMLRRRFRGCFMVAVALPPT